MAVKANHRLNKSIAKQSENSLYSPLAGTQDATSRPPHLVLSAQHKSNGQPGARLTGAAKVVRALGAGGGRLGELEVFVLAMERPE